MSDFIEREPVAIFVEECGCSPKWIAKRIRNQEAFPAADVAPVVHGRWVNHFDYMMERSGFFVCDSCKKMSREKYDYCPNCGALMDGKEDEDEAD